MNTEESTNPNVYRCPDCHKEHMIEVLAGGRFKTREAASAHYRNHQLATAVALIIADLHEETPARAEFLKELLIRYTATNAVPLTADNVGRVYGLHRRTAG